MNNLIDILEYHTYKIKYCCFVENQNQILDTKKDIWYFITDNDFGDEVILEPKEPGPFITFEFDDKGNEVYMNEFRGKKICVAPTVSKAFLGLGIRDWYEYKVYETTKPTRAYRAINTHPLSDEHYLFNATTFKKMGELGDEIIYDRDFLNWCYYNRNDRYEQYAKIFLEKWK